MARLTTEDVTARRPSRFERPVEDLTATELVVARSAFAAADSTFADFEDEPDSHYYRAGSMSPRNTWHALTVETARVTAIAAVEAHQGGRVEPSDFEAVHRAVFEPVFGDEALTVRRHEEDVTYGIVRGRRARPDFSSRQRGISGRSLPKRLHEIAEDLNNAFRLRDEAVVAGRSRPTIAAVRPAAAAYCRLLAAHPFVDGNGRTAFPILNFAMIRLGLVAVSLPETDDFHWCLGAGMRQDGHRDVEPMAWYLRDLIVSSAAASADRAD